MEPVKLGIIGCGIAARELHWPALKTMPDKFTITMACNHTEQKAKEYADMAGGVPHVLDYREVLDSGEVEAVSIALPFHLNYEVTRAALEAGKHVIVEKPIASTLEEARAMVDLAAAHPSMVTLVAENLRYRPLYARVRELVDSGAIGEPYFVLWNYFFFVDPAANKYAQTPWRMEERYPGGFIVDAGVHHAAVLRLLFGEFASGRGQTASVTPALGKYDTFSFQFAMDSGVDGVMNLFYSARGLVANTMHIFGDADTLVVTREELTIKRDGEQDMTELFGDDMGYVAEFGNFFDAIRSGAPVVSTFGEAYRDYEVIVRGLESAETGGEVIYM